MKNRLIFFFKSMLLISLCLTLITSCAKKGCMDKFALNWNDGAEEDDGSCIYNADKMAGNWNVAVTFDNDSTTNFTATIIKLDNNHIKVLNGSQVEYSSIKVDVISKTMICDGGCSPWFEVTFSNENDLLIYDWGFQSGNTPHWGYYHYTR
jgi:hypothetical protein